MISKMIKYGLLTTILVGALSSGRLVPSAGAQQSVTSATDALQKAHVLNRLAEATAGERKGSAPGFVLDPAWPQPLPHHWVIGDVGGIAVDKHDHIWVYHRPRSVSSTDSGMQGAAGKDAKGKPISALGFPRPYGQMNGCCMPAPSVLVFDKAGKLLQSWGGPGDPGFLKRNAASRTVASGLRASTGSTSIRTTSSTSRAMARPVISMVSIRGRRISGTIRRS